MYKRQVDSITHEIILSFLGRVQLEVVSALLAEKYKIETAVKEPTVIYLERPLKAANHTIHIEVPPNPFWASIGLSVTPVSYTHLDGCSDRAVPTDWGTGERRPMRQRF